MWEKINEIGTRDVEYNLDVWYLPGMQIFPSYWFALMNYGEATVQLQGVGDPLASAREGGDLNPRLRHQVMRSD